MERISKLKSLKKEMEVNSLELLLYSAAAQHTSISKRREVEGTVGSFM